MKPKRIILVRHGESEGNVNLDNFQSIQDFKMDLTPKGVEQAKEAGLEILKIIGNEKIGVYLSPYRRTRQTFENIRTNIDANVVKAVEDPRIREQDWGHFKGAEESGRISDERDKYGNFYFRIPDGESGADVYDRVSTFLETLHRDFAKKDFPQNTLIVTHGMLMRLFLMRWFHWTVERFETYRNPGNCEVVVMELETDGHYGLRDEGQLLRRR